MGTGIKTTAATWSRANASIFGFMPAALREHVKGEYLFGVDAATSVVNLADPSKPLTVQGSPTYGANSATVRSDKTGSGYGFKTGIEPDFGCTLVLIRKNAAIASVPCIMGRDDTDTLGMGFRQFGADNYMSGGEGLYTNGAKRTRPASASAVYFEMVTHEHQGYATARYGNAGALTKVISAHQTSMNSRMKTDNTNKLFTEICIGSNSLTDSINNNSCEVFYAAIVNASFTDGQADALYQALRTYYTGLSITVE